ncbi:TPA: hypothetical protein OHQ33_001981 [Escherichia coli]|nr:hypothetical protein [Escherichia coli]
MPKITIASLERRILVLESEKQTLGGQLSINGEYQLAAFKVLLSIMKQEPNVYAGLFVGESESSLAYYNTANAALKNGADVIVPLYDNVVGPEDESA